MATSRAFPTLRLRHQALIAALVCVIGGLIGSRAAVGESISSSDFKIDIASNVAWIDNHDPAVGRKLWRQTAMEQAVIASRPYVRVTNNSAGGQVENFQLNLSQRESTRITDVLLPPDQVGSQWKWSPDLSTMFVDFAKPVDSGESFLIRVATGPDSALPGSYSLLQNFFAPGQPIFGQTKASGMPGYGQLGLVVQDPTLVTARTRAAVAAVNDINAQHFSYSLESVVIDPYKTAGQQVGITITAVPEPSTVALLSVAAIAGGAGCFVRRRRQAA